MYYITSMYQKFKLQKNVKVFITQVYDNYYDFFK